VKKLIQRCLGMLGWQLKKIRKREVEELLFFLKLHKINQILDIGANEGQFAETLISSGYKGSIISFEPTSRAHEILSVKTLNYENWTAFDRVAIGSNNCEIMINLSKNSVSSSILPVLQKTIGFESTIRYVGEEKVTMVAIDSLKCIPKGVRTFLKADIQGYEYEALKGATSRLSEDIHGVQIEVSVTELYEGQGKIVDILEFLFTKGFEIWSFSEEFVDKKTGRILQANITLFRS